MSSKIENQKRRILAVDDDPESIRLLKAALEWDGYQVSTATSGEAALDKIATWHPHLILLDVRMPGINGLETLVQVRKSEEYVSTLFISGQSNSEDIIRGLDAGADDYICKPFHPPELLARIRCHLRIKDIRDQLNRANQRLKELAETDDLTGLYNMRSLYQKLDFELDRAHRYGRSVAVVMMDMDNFKLANDENDHLFGSFVLSQVGQIIKSNMRKVDLAARYGGDEFLIILTETNLDGAQTFCERIRSEIGNHIFRNEHHERKLTASLGFSFTDSGRMDIDAHTLVRYADRALYEAKEKGRNRIVYHSFTSDLNAGERAEGHKALRRRRKSG